MMQQALLTQLEGLSTQPSRSLTPQEEQQFREWYGALAGVQGLSPDPDDPQHFYDYRSAFRKRARPDAGGHMPSTFKTLGHPASVVGGFHVKTGQRVPGTPQASEQELIRLGWDPAFARRVSRR